MQLRLVLQKGAGLALKDSNSPSALHLIAPVMSVRADGSVTIFRSSGVTSLLQEMHDPKQHDG